MVALGRAGIPVEAYYSSEIDQYAIQISKKNYPIIYQPIFKTIRGVKWDTSGKGYFSQANRAYGVDGKSPTVPTCRTITKTKIYRDGKVGELHYEEMERLQGLPDGYTEGIKNKEIRGGLIGNAFNVDVGSWILSFIPKM
jgi:site-specific DNA-cytosine methylase